MHGVSGSTRKAPARCKSVSHQGKPRGRHATPLAPQRHRFARKRLLLQNPLQPPLPKFLESNPSLPPLDP